MPQWIENLHKMSREELQEEIKHAYTQVYRAEEKKRSQQEECSALRQVITELRKALNGFHNSPSVRLVKILKIFSQPGKFPRKALLVRLWKKVFYKQPLMPEYNVLAPIDRILQRIQQIPQSDISFSSGISPEKFAGEVFIFAVVPMDDIGGGQRSSQLTRCLLQRMYKVHYIYRFPKMEDQLFTANEYTTPQLSHRYFPNFHDPEEIFSGASSEAQVIFELPHPDFLPCLEKAADLGLKCTYELIDPWDTQLGENWYNAETEQIFINSCTHITATARTLCQHIRDCGRADVTYVPNAADNRFFQLHSKFERPGDLPEQYDKIILYIGSMYGVWFHWGALRLAAERNPQTAFYMIGSPPDFPVELPGNVLFAGLRENVELNSYLAYADAAVIPFVPGRLTNAVSPVKVFEYLFAGCPVISLKMPELDGYPGVYQAEDENDFAQLCTLEKIHPPTLQERETFITRHTWDHRLDLLLPSPLWQHSFSIIITHQTPADGIEKLLDSLLFHCSNVPQEIIVADTTLPNSHSQLTEKQYENKVTWLHFRGSRSAARNLASAQASREILVFLEADMRITSAAWLREYEFLHQQHPGIGAFSQTAGFFVNDALDTVTLTPSAPAVLQHSEYFYKNFRTDIHYLEANGLLIPKKLFLALGGFDPIYEENHFDCQDFSLKLRKAGYQIGCRHFSGLMRSHFSSTPQAVLYEKAAQLIRAAENQS